MKTSQYQSTAANLNSADFLKNKQVIREIENRINESDFNNTSANNQLFSILDNIYKSDCTESICGYIKDFIECAQKNYQSSIITNDEVKTLFNGNDDWANKTINFAENIGKAA
jgi:hypothetical protein